MDASQVTDVHNYRYVLCNYALSFSLNRFRHKLFAFGVFLCKCWSLFVFSFFSFWHRIFVATWNVAGKSPPSCLNLEDWLHTSPPADIYVLGYVCCIDQDVCLKIYRFYAKILW